MNNIISVVINTFNEEKYLERCIKSVKPFASEILVCDMYSSDQSASLAKKLGAKVIFHKWVNFVEPARNYAISKANGNWVLIMDPDEEIPETLSLKLKEIVSEDSGVDFVQIPRKNIVFGKWMKASMWWPDNNIRFFKKGKVTWSNKIHLDPNTSGQGLTLPDMEEYAIIHHHYDGVGQFLVRLNRYTDVQSNELFRSGIKFHWSDLIEKPLGEFLGRFFANKGYLDGVHGLALSLLQAFSHLVVYLKLWESYKFTQQELSLKDIKKETLKTGKEIKYWIHTSSLSNNPVKRLLQKAKGKLVS